MNTPPTPKRYKPPARDKIFGGPKGTFTCALTDPKIAVAFATFVSTFEHLEAMEMPGLLAALVRTTDSTAASYVYRSMIAPKAKFTVLQNLLEHAPFNASLGPEFDNALSEFDSLRTMRHKYVHGLWYTRDDGTVWMSTFDIHGLSLTNAKQVHVRELQALQKRTLDLLLSVANLKQQIARTMPHKGSRAQRAGHNP